MAANMTNAEAELSSECERSVLTWYDFVCPFCYIGQQRSALLAERGFEVIELPFQAHPEIPADGVAAGPRTGLMYTRLEQEAKAAELPLNWPPRLPNTRLALAAAEWVRQQDPEAFADFHRALFAAHFVAGEDLGEPAVIDRHAHAFGVDLEAMHAALADGSALAMVAASEKLGRQAGVQGTPAWWLDGKLISGLQPVSKFEQLAATRL